MNITLINDLIDNHGDTFTTCKGCHLCDQIKRLGTVQAPAEKFKHLLAKGQDMTKSDIELMLENEVQSKDIQKALGMNGTEFYKLFKNLGIRRGSVGDLCMPVEEYYQLKEEGLKDSEIAEIKGVKAYVLRNWKYKNGIKAGDVQAVTPRTRAPKKENKSAEYESLIAKLKEQLSDKAKDIEAQNERIETQAKLIEKLNNYIEEKENLNAACDDVETELDSVKEERDNYRSQLLETRDKLVRLDYAAENQKKIIEDTGKVLERYERENKALRALVRAWA